MSSVHNKRGFVPIDCPICQFMMRDIADASQYYATQCCVDCWIGFLEPLRLLNKDEGYLPNETELKAYRKKMSEKTSMEKQSVKLKRD